MTDNALSEVARLWGVQSGYWDVSGTWHEANQDALRQVLVGLGAPIADGDLSEAVVAHKRLMIDQMIEPVMVVPFGGTLGFVLRLENRVASDATVEVEVTAEDGFVHRAVMAVELIQPYEGGTVDGRSYSTRWVDTGIELPLGYHRARVTVAAQSKETLVLAPPSRFLQLSHKTWGAFAPSYAMVPTGNPGADHLGIAHLGHLDDLGRRINAFGGRIVSTLPLLATYLDRPFEPSPYSPVSRRWWSELYLDPTSLPGLSECPRARALLGSNRVAEAAAALASGRMVNYEGAARLITEVLDAVVGDLEDTTGQTAGAMAQFDRAHPELDRYAYFRAKVEKFGVEAVKGRPGESLAVDPLVVNRHRYIQFAADAQMAHLAASFRSRNQLLALDLPLGANPEGFDVWADPGNFAQAATGAPPDEMFSGGQNWGFPPAHPMASRARGHQDFISAARHHLRHAGILRVDHLMSLERLWWIPQGFAATEGIYVRYPTQELVAILAIEAARAETIVVGENLGTVSDEINEAMNKWGMLGMYELQFEPGYAREHGHLRAPPSRTVASLNTHDMPTFAGWWTGRDLETSLDLGVITAEERTHQHQMRVADRVALTEALAADLEVPLPVEPGPVLEASLAWLGATPADVVLVNLEDLWLEEEPQNVPGTHRELPNWRRRFDRTVAKALSEPKAMDLLATLDRVRRSAPEEEPT